jgi:hypothetical protein
MDLYGVPVVVVDVFEVEVETSFPLHILGPRELHMILLHIAPCSTPPFPTTNTSYSLD